MVLRKRNTAYIQLIGDAKKLINDNPEKHYKVVLDFNDNIKKRMKIDLAPEVTDINEILKYEAIKDKLIESSNVQFSTYKGENL